MVQLIVGEKGKGKTKYLLDMANTSISSVSGNIVFIDKNQRHMYELNNKIRLIDASKYPLANGDEFIGFICGIASQDHDLEQIYIDGFLDNTKITDDSQIKTYIDQLAAIGELCNVNFIISVSRSEEALDPALKELILEF